MTEPGRDVIGPGAEVAEPGLGATDSGPGVTQPDQVTSARRPPSLVGDGRWRRPAARSLLVTPLRTAREMIPALAPVVVVAFSQGGRAYWLLLLLVALPVAVAGLRWWNIGYRIAEGQFQVRHGILQKHRLTTQLDRIRTVDAEASLLRRLLRIVDLHVGTGAHEAVTVHGIDAAEAAQLHRALLARRPHQQQPPTSESPSMPPPERTIAAFTAAWLRFAPFTMSGVATALTAWAVGTRLINDLHLGGAVAPWIERARDATSDANLVILVVEILLAAVLTLSVLSLIAYALANWGYRLTRRADATLHIRRGLLTSRAVTIEERRLRGLVVERPLVLRIPGGARAKGLVTGGKHADRGARSSHVLVPPAPASVVDSAMADILGTAAPLRVRLVRHGHRATRRRYTRALFWLWPVAGAAAVVPWVWSWPRWTYVAPALVLALVPALGALRARWLGHAILGDPRVLQGPSAGYVVASSGAFPQEYTCLRSRAIIGWVMRESWFQRRAGLVTLAATVATTGGRVLILDVPKARAVEIIQEATPGLLDRYVVGGPRRRQHQLRRRHEHRLRRRR